MNLALLGAFPADDSRFGLEYAAAAYAVIFITYFAYVARLFLLARRLERRLDALELEAGGTGGGSRG